MKYTSLLVFVLSLSFISSSNAQFFEEDHLITDVRNNIVWLRCSVGQTWVSKKIKPALEISLSLTTREIEIAQEQASNQLGGKWRLPTLRSWSHLFAKVVVLQNQGAVLSGISPEAY